MKKALKRFLQTLIVTALVPGLFVALHHSEAQMTDAQKLEQEKILQAELEQVLKEIEDQKKVLNSQRAESASIERDISILDGQIREARLKLDASNIRVRQLSKDIDQKNEIIAELEDKISREKRSLAQTLQQLRETSDKTLVEVFLASGSLAEYFKESDSLEAIKYSVLADLEKITAHQEETSAQKKELEQVKLAQEDVSYEIEREKKVVEINQNQKSTLLSASKQQEKTYEQIVKEREEKAAAIRSALFSLRDSTDINFGQALEFAKLAEKRTGVRPAFLLAILTQESNLGKNVGSCVITDLSSGQTKSVNSGTVFSNGIHPTRDLPLLQTILAELGRNPLDTKVSCPIGNTGYGGAMGPAQFIPSTWISYAHRVAGVTGVSPANPWSARDAFTASSLFLADLGASAGTFSAEWEAAGRYYAGGNWQTAGAGYANSVLNIAASIQSQIDTLDSLN